MTQVSQTAIHEAAHAVVAAHLRVPFSAVTIRPKKVNGMMTAGHMMPKPHANLPAMAITVLAARAAEEIDFPDHMDEFGFSGDEDNLRTIAAAYPNPGVDFDVWRESMLEHAREIVRLPQVSRAITVVAMLLEAEYALFKRGIPAREVRECLRFAKANTQQLAATAAVR